MARSPLTGLLKEAFSSAVKEDEKLAALMNERQISRRSFLRHTVVAAGGAVLVPGILRGNSLLGGAVEGRAYGPATPVMGSLPAVKKVVIIGAGIAGLNACYQLKKQGIHATVYEASGRVGGRMFTMRDQFGPGITTDIGGEFVDTTHTDIHLLAKELGLSFYDLRKDTLTAKTYYFGGKQISQQDLRMALVPFLDRLVTDIHSLPEKISHETADSFRHLDNQSITEYISAIGIKGWLYDYLNVTLTREYGMEAAEQSAVNFLIMFDAPANQDGDYELFGSDHEVFKIKGGSQHLTDALYQQVKDQVILNHTLAAVAEGAHSDYRLSIGNNGAAKDVHADYVLITIPFALLRHIPFHVDMPPEKKRCIESIGYGNSCKFIIGVDDKPWRRAGKKGYTFTDISFGCGWDSSQIQSEDKGGFTVFGGGHFGDEMAKKTKEELISEYIPGLEEIYPGAAKAYNGKNVKFCWKDNPFSKAGYSSFKKGQWSTLAGWEGVPVGNIYFAGEHVSLDFQGYMNGGAQTAREAVERMVKQMTAERS